MDDADLTLDHQPEGKGQGQYVWRSDTEGFWGVFVVKNDTTLARHTTVITT